MGNTTTAYLVTDGALRRIRYGDREEWDNGRSIPTERVYSTLDEARAAYDAIDIRDALHTEISCSTPGTSRNKGEYRELSEVYLDEDGEIEGYGEIIDGEEYTYDDYDRDRAGRAED